MTPGPPDAHAARPLGPGDIDTLAWTRGDGLLPAIVQDAATGRVLMLAWMDREALRRTLERPHVTFWSRSRRALWVKGATSGNLLHRVAVHTDCDRDALLVLARPSGPACHRGTPSCFADAPSSPATGLAFLARLEAVIDARLESAPPDSYTAQLLAQGPLRIAQKVGEEGLEVALAAAAGQPLPSLCSESADLLFHLLLLLRSRGLTLGAVVAELERRHASTAAAGGNSGGG